MTKGPDDRFARRRVLRDSIGIGMATGTYGLSFGALSVLAGLDVWQTGVLSAVMFTGASQFAFVGVIAAGGSPVAAAASAVLLGTRNTLYGLHLSTIVTERGLRRAGAAHLVLDESAAMSLAAEPQGLGRLGFYATGWSVFFGWNLATLAGALGAQALSDPGRYGLDAVAPAAFLALLAPRLRDRANRGPALLAVLVCLLCAPLVPAGTPVLLAALCVVVLVLARPGVRA
ncbi:MAG: AzlC family ABC transporter permease [Austwickia sp.]|nr:AzlC family ABC transporter permease [Austwickia sp.]MBK8435156.1 AzlC family ABC transporter permease [Austwickia sp.]MBK9101290.1 AzlC family ABC transporter permease [Austwickia sp.]